MSDTLDEGVRRLWLRFRPVVEERLGDLQAWAPLAGDTDPDAVRAAERAREASHKLAGALGSYGLHTASRTAEQLQRLACAPPRRGAGELAQRLTDDLRRAVTDEH